MKYILALAFLACFWGSIASPSVYRQLVAVNQYWEQQKDIKQNLLPASSGMSDKAWIRLHLSLVEQTLRDRPVTHLSATQQQLRSKALDDLHQYWIAGNFPLNEQYSYRTPIFIDKQDNFCAVGYLIKASGQEEISRMISSDNNLAYVMDMRYPELNTWAKGHGFTKEELAWIQPTYPPQHYTATVGGGTDGKVAELFAGQNGENLYVGGVFSKVGNNIAAHNIAYITKDNNDNYNWHNMGTGINGPVYAICEYNGKIFAGGAFSTAGGEGVNNIAYWENGAWHGAGCLYGTVLDLIVFNGELYAAGTFDVCAALSDINFAKWNGTAWSQIPGLSGQVNTLEVMGDKLLLGGRMRYMDNDVNAIAWSPVAGQGFLPFSNNITNSVSDFEMFKGSMYAVCSRIDVTSTSPVLLKLDGNSWLPVYEPAGSEPFMPVDDKLSLNTLLVEGNTLLTGGRFQFVDMMYPTSNCADITPAPYPSGDKYFYTNDAINKMIWFKNDLIAGGLFESGMDPVGAVIPLGGIARRISRTSGIANPGAGLAFRIYPNPLSGNKMLTIENGGTAEQLSVYDIAGKVIFKTALKAGKEIQQVQLPAMAPALYMVELRNKGAKLTQKLLLQ